MADFALGSDRTVTRGLAGEIRGGSGGARDARREGRGEGEEEGRRERYEGGGRVQPNDDGI